jgi:hypothetical protein
MIVDDKWITVGSDRDGFEASTEFDLGINSSKLAVQLRVKLWTEHIGIRQHDSQSSDTNLNNFDEGFKLLDKVAQDNGKRVQGGEPIKGNIYYYNFVLRKLIEWNAVDLKNSFYNYVISEKHMLKFLDDISMQGCQ